MKTPVRNELILSLHSKVGSGLKKEIENELPELFRNRLEVGRWYKHPEGEAIFCFKGFEEDRCFCYGIGTLGLWTESFCVYKNDKYIPATDEEVKAALIKECLKLGIDEKGNFEVVRSTSLAQVHPVSEWHFCAEINELYTAPKGMGGRVVFSKGKFAKPIEPAVEMTLSQIEERLGHKVKIKND